MRYTSTRDASIHATAAQAIITGLAPGGGLFVPEQLGRLDVEALKDAPYADVAFAVLETLLPEWDGGALLSAIRESYGAPFGGKAGQLVRLREGLYSLELWHGPTSAFKDYALQLMPKLLVQAKKIEGRTEKTLVLVATSGDTGKAALEGFKDVENTGICVFYPNSGISKVQRLQMETQQGANVAVYAVAGNFDDAQRGVKKTFGSAELAETLAERGICLSSANSINWGRLAPQIVYYVTSYLHIWREGGLQFGDPLDFCVPTGNFGDILAGYYAKQMGLPVGKLVCASNQNNVLTEFFETGVYNARREFFKTSSPSMDILVSSNLERLLFHAGGSAERVRGWMDDLAKTGAYRVEADVLGHIRETFAAGWAGEEAVAEEIAAMMREYKYLTDPHTAVAFHVLRGMARDAARPAVVLSTASPYKFSKKVLASLGQAVPADEFDALDALEALSGLPVPAAIQELQNLPLRFERLIGADEIRQIPLSLDFM